MKLVKCPNKHFYDGDAFVSCPHCSGEIPESAKAVATDSSGGRFSQTGGSLQPSGNPMSATQPLREPISQSPIEELLQTGSPQALVGQPGNPQPPTAMPTQATPAAPATPATPLSSAVSASVQYNLPEETQKTVGFYDFGGIEPVVGWLVCVKGEHHGQSFQLKSGYNIIGRDLKMDVALTKDGGVSRNRHAVIMFDPKNAKFYIQQGESGLTYLDGELVLSPTLMKTRALIGIGGGEYLFVPFCGDNFSWDDYKQ